MPDTADFSDAAQFGLNVSATPPSAPAAKVDFSDAGKFGLTVSTKPSAPVASADFSDAGKFGLQVSSVDPAARQRVLDQANRNFAELQRQDNTVTVPLDPNYGGSPTVEMDMNATERAVPVLGPMVTAPFRGTDNLIGGTAQIANAKGDSAELLRGGGKVFTGIGQIAAPAFPAAAATAPVEAAAWYALSKGLGGLGTYAGKKSGLSDEDSQELGDVLSTAPMLYGGGKILAGKFSDAIDAHNQRAADLIAQDAAAGKNADIARHVVGDDGIPVGPDGWKVVDNGASAKHVSYAVQDATGKTLFAGSSREVQGWLKSKGIERSVVPPESAAAIVEQAQGSQAPAPSPLVTNAARTAETLHVPEDSPAPVEPAPPEPAPVEPAPVEPAPVDAAARHTLDLGDAPDHGLTISDHAPLTALPSENDDLGRGREGRVSGTSGAVSGRPTAGEETSVVIPGEDREIGGRYEVRDLSELQASHNGLTFLANPDYAHQNERDYSKPENQQRVINQASEEKFNPRYLITDNPDATNGPPVIDEKGHVLGGNSRAMTMQIVYGRNAQAADSYRALLAKKAANFGIDPESFAQMPDPVLVRVASDAGLDALPDGSKWAIRKTNVSGTAALSASERATADAGQLSPELKGSIAQAIDDAGPGATLNDALTGRAGTALVNQLIAKGFFSEQERPSLMDGKTGALTQLAKDRISKALLGEFFHNSDQFQRFPAALKQKLERVAAPLATVAGDPEWDLLPHVREAVDLIEHADAHGLRNLDDAVAQTDMFGAAPKYGPQAVAIAKLLRDGKPNDVVGAFRKYVNSKEPTMFGESTPDEAFHEAMFARDLERPMEPEGPEEKSAWTSVSPTYSLDQIYRNADWEKLPERHNRPSRLRLNRQALDMLRNAIKHPGYSGVSTRDSGLFGRALRQHVDRLHADGEIGAEARENAHRLADMLRTMHGSSAIQYLSDSSRSIRDRADLLREELTHSRQAQLTEDLTVLGHVSAEAMMKHPLWPIVRRALLLRNYPDHPDVLAAEAGAKLAAGLHRQLDLPKRDAIRLLAHYYRNLEAQHGRAKAEQVIAFTDRMTRRDLDDELRGTTPFPDQPRGPSVPRKGGGGDPDGGPHSWANSVRRLPSGRRGGSDGEVQGDVPGEEPSLFDSATNEQVASEAAHDRDQLTGDRLTAQLNSPLTRDEQLKKLKPSKANPQSSLFEDNRDPQGSLFLGSGLGVLQPYYEKYVAKQVDATAAKVGEALALAKDDILKLAAPAARGEAAHAAALTVRKNAAELQRSSDRAEAALRIAARFFDTLPEDERLDFMDRIERGDDQETPELDRIAAIMREMLDSRREAIRALGTGKLSNFIENYFPHIWKKPELAKELSANYGKRPIEGAKGFLKQRSLETIADGIKAGLTPISTNPVDLVLLKAREMDKYLMAHHILADLKRQGLLQYVDARDGRAPAGWQKIDDPVATVYGQSVQPITEYPNAGLWDGLAKVQQALGLTHDRGFTMRGPAVGYAYKGKDHIATRHGSAEDVVAHEIGHQIDWLAGSGKKFVTEYPSKEMAERLQRLRRAERDKSLSTEQRSAARKELKDLDGVIQDRKQFAQELRALADLRRQPEEYRRKREEKMALLAELWVSNRDLFEKTAPHVYSLWKQFLDENPKLHAFRDIAADTEVTPISHPYDVGGVVIRGHWWAPEPAARILNHYLSPSLRDQSALVRGFFSASNLLNQAQLGFSGFHAIFTGLEAVTSKLALGIYQAAHGDIGAGLKSAATAPLATVSTLRRGSRMLAEWYNPGTQGPLIGQLVDAAVAAGGRARMESFYRTHIAKKMMQSWREGNIWGALWRAPFAAFEAPTQAIMGELVPRLKMGAFADLAQYELSRLPENASIEEAYAALAKSWDSIDNRFGQLVYDNLFWHKYTKDIALLLVRSPGWNVGDIRELGGGYADSAKFVTGGLKKLAGGSGGNGGPDFTHRMSYLPAHLLVAATVGALLYYFWHGKAPEHLKDYFFPPDAQGHRKSVPTYVKDEYNWADDPGRTAANKVNPLVSYAKAVLTNRDWRDKPIRKAHDSLPKQVEELALYTLQQFEPIWLQQWLDDQGGHQTLDQRILPEVGITPAPKSLDHPQHR